MRVLILGDTMLSHAVARVLGDTCVGCWAQPQDWPACDLAVSAGYRYRVPASVLERLPIVNLHTGFLPYNRGSYPNVWPIVDGTPAGVTVHWMDAGLDTGDIIARREVSVEPWDTAWTLHHRLETEVVRLFSELWPGIRDGTAPRVKQEGPWTEHRKRDLESVTLRYHQTMPVERLLAILRARSYPGYQGVVLEENGKRWEVTIQCRPV